MHVIATDVERFHSEERLIRLETRRLRLDYLKAVLDLGLTMASLADTSYCSENLRDLSHAGALKGYVMVTRLLHRPGWNDMDRLTLQDKLESLAAALKIAAVPREPASREPQPALKLVGAPAVNGGSGELTKRELQVLRYVAEGYSTKQVAAALGIAFKTAACHRYRIMDKLQIHDTAGLVRYAIRRGVIAA
jgi:DNA-binding CsgD family transcriptional regulator